VQASEDQEKATPSSGWPPWLLWLAALLLVAVSVALVLRRGPAAQSHADSLDGKLQMFVRPKPGAAQPLGIDEAGALPVHAGGSMNMEVHLEQDAMIYLVWFDAEGNIVPLYPWNTDTLETKDIGQTPPVRRASKVVFSPLTLGGGWVFGKQSGSETIILLARRTPLPADLALGDLLKKLPPPPKLEDSATLATVRITAAKDRGAKSRIEPKDSPLATFLAPLADHFDLIHAIQLAHADD